MKLLTSLGVFAFDQSTNHGAYANDALLVQRMTLNPKVEKTYKFRDGWFFSNGHKVQQAMFSDESGIRTFKGLKRILEERSLWTGIPRLQCTTTYNRPPKCCARHVLESQPDFREQRTALESEVISSGQIFTMYPKFHCECNFIERYWGAAKRTARQECDYSFRSLANNLSSFLDQVSLAVIRRFARKAWRYIDAYCKDYDAKTAEFAVKKYKSHRRIPEGLDRDIDQS